MISLTPPDSESSDSIMTLSSDNESDYSNDTDVSGESCIEPYDPSQKVRIIIKIFVYFLENVLNRVSQLKSQAGQKNWHTQGPKSKSIRLYPFREGVFFQANRVNR